VIDGKYLFDRLWTFYQQTLSPEGMSALDFAQLVTYLLFLKIDDERSQRRVNPVQVVPDGLGWQSLAHKTGSALEEQYRHIVQECAKSAPQPQTRIRQAVFRSAALNPRCTPASLHSLIDDAIIEFQWSVQSRSALHDMYSLLLEKASIDFQIGSGQTLTPEPLASAVVDCMHPDSSDIVIDPACGTGSLLVAAQQAIARAGNPLQSGAVTGADFDPIMCRLGTMNYLLSTGEPLDSSPPVQGGNSLAAPMVGSPSVVVCNPPFRSTAPLPEGRTDLWARSSSMQLNFLQHIARGLPIGARAAVFVPDNILFGEGAEAIVRRTLLDEYDVHTLLRLPTGVFARGSVQTNVIFFDAVRRRGDGSPATSQLWVYDFRTGQRFAARQRPLRRSDLEDFERCYAHGEPRAGRSATERFRAVSYEGLVDRQFNLNIFWRDEADPGAGANPKEIALEIVDELTAALDDFKMLAEDLPDGPNEE
jgi:type I restriction enzyme M protein